MVKSSKYKLKILFWWDALTLTFPLNRQTVGASKMIFLGLNHDNYGLFMEELNNLSVLDIIVIKKVFGFAVCSPDKTIKK